MQPVKTQPPADKPIIVVRAILFSARIPRMVCHHALGKEHTQAHRIMVGIAFIAAGIFIAHLTEPDERVYVSLAGVGLGDYLRAVGCAPFLEAMGAEI